MESTTHHSDRGTTMKRIIIFAVAIVAAIVPAVVGLSGNASFAQSVPVRVPSQAQLVVDDHGGRRGSDSVTSEPTSTSSESSRSSDSSPSATRTSEAGDDKGGGRGRSGGGDDGPGHQ
jgi:hypothetical protein